MKTQRFTATTVLLATMGLSGAALAAEPGPYFGLQGAATFLHNADNSGSGVNITSQYKTGYHVAGVVGWNTGQDWRIEAEIGYRRNSLDKLTIANDGGLGPQLIGLSAAAHGHVSATDVMGNIWYDFDMGNGWKPYLGGGIGWGYIKLNNLNVNNTPMADDSTNVFAYQVGGGIGYALAPQTTVSVDYRFFGTSTPTLHLVDGTSFDSQYRTNNVGLSLRYRF